MGRRGGGLSSGAEGGDQTGDEAENKAGKEPIDHDEA
jgi:hypothetical protein